MFATVKVAPISRPIISSAIASVFFDSEQILKILELLKNSILAFAKDMGEHIFCIVINRVPSD